MPPSRKLKGKGRARDSGLDANGRPAKIKRVKEVVYDPEARKEYLTGFSKRKKAKQTERRNRAISREKDALRQMRTQVREQRKEQAAHNVRMAREAYGDAEAEDEEDEDDESDEEDSAGSDSGESDEGGPVEYEAPDGDLATVVVEPLSLSRSPTPEPLPSAVPRAGGAGQPGPPPAQQRSLYKKRVKNTVQARPKMSREDKKARATGGKKVRKQLANRMKGTKGKAVK